MRTEYRLYADFRDGSLQSALHDTGMPASGVQSFCHSDVLNYEEIVRVVRQAAALGIRHLRVTGGEPMVRKGCMELIDMLHRIPGIETIALTTNAMLLDGRVQEIRTRG